MNEDTALLNFLDAQSFSGIECIGTSTGGLIKRVRIGNVEASGTNLREAIKSAREILQERERSMNYTHFKK